MNNSSLVIELFRKYGFEYRKSLSNSDFLAFTYSSGFFHNAELVSVESEQNQVEIEARMEESARGLEDLGFSTKKSFYSSIKEVEQALFEGFFEVEKWKEQIKNDYESHVERILSVLPGEDLEYEYIQAPCVKNNRLLEASIVDEICREIQKEKPKLFIIEAPAGFGKTSTSYEIINKLITDFSTGPIPFFTEFARDRQAKVFSHIFVREVDRSFSSVKSGVVIDAVKEGNIAVVLDGFDELLQDSAQEEVSDDLFESAEPMLETISELLVNNAKIILTSRRSALFDGDKFYEWLEKYDYEFTIDRYRIKEPDVENWLEYERLEKLKSSGLDVRKLANPVLLSYLRFNSETKFNELCKNPVEIVDQYFHSMLEREMERQSLRMSVEQQTMLLMSVASDMCDNDYTIINKDKLISFFKDNLNQLLNEVRSLYPASEKPSLDGLANILANHAFFDKSNQENKLQFINEFVFGNYIANVILEAGVDWMANDERFVEPAVLSYSSRTNEEKSELWKSLQLMKSFLDASSRMKFEALLTSEVNESSSSSADITSIVFDSIRFFDKAILSNYLFNRCTFQNIEFNLQNFRQVTFLDCSFWNCSFNIGDHGIDISLYKCKDNNSFISDIEALLLGSDENVLEDGNDNEFSEVEYALLEMAWPLGASTIPRLHYFIGNFFKNDKFERKEILKAIKSLKLKQVFEDANDSNFVQINKSKLGDIKELLGRGI